MTMSDFSLKLNDTFTCPTMKNFPIVYDFSYVITYP